MEGSQLAQHFSNSFPPSVYVVEVYPFSQLQKHPCSFQLSSSDEHACSSGFATHWPVDKSQTEHPGQSVCLLHPPPPDEEDELDGGGGSFVGSSVGSSSVGSSPPPLLEDDESPPPEEDPEEELFPQSSPQQYIPKSRL